ncbi:CPBP family glutamic-type intramembrane protease [Spiroplasma attinicola]|uniref:CPBP family glutamic-type intramembrane protease n=1 Tax=Spiroplasma attinicola TaxID=2904537 RepID=UPI0035BE436A
MNHLISNFSDDNQINHDEKVKNSKLSFFKTKELSSEHDFPFNFKNPNWFVTVIYLVSFILVPIIYSLIKTYGYHISSSDSASKSWSVLDLVLTILVPIIGMIIAFIIDWKAMAKRGAWAAYTHFIFGFISSLIVILFLVQTKAIDQEKNESLFLAVSFIIQVVIQFIGSLIVVFTNKGLRKQIVATFKEAKVSLLLWVITFLVIITVLNLIFNTISNAVNQTNFFANNNGASDNQDQLERMATTPLGIFALVLGSIFLAPINEEISYRYGTFSIVRNKWIAYIASLVYFPAMHILDSGDWNNIFGYLGMSIATPLLFIIARGNTTYTIALHMLVNTIATVSLFISLS